MRLDARGWQAAARACEKLLADLARVEHAASKRLAKHPDAEAASHAAVVMMLFETVRLAQPQPKPKLPARRAKATTR